MVEDRIGYRYAKSVFSLAKENNVVPDTREDMALILSLHDENRDFANFLRSPLISSPQKEQILIKIFSGNLKTDIVDHLVRLIARKGREMYLPFVAKSFLEIYDEENGILRGKLVSAQKLSAATVASIKTSVEQETGKSFEMSEEVDPGLIGGFVLEVGDRQFDGSIASSLRKIKQEFTKNN